MTRWGTPIIIGPKGKADILGIRAKDGKFLSIEVKVGPDKLNNDQRSWMAMIKKFGGLAIECRSLEDIETIL